MGNYWIWAALAVVLAWWVWARFFRRGDRTPIIPPHHRQTVIKNRRYRVLRGLTLASLKMYFRNRSAIIFSLFFPIFFIIVFGTIFQNINNTKFNIDLSNQSNSPLSQQFVSALDKVAAYRVKQVSVTQAQSDLDQGKTDLQIIIPADFGQTQDGRLVPSQVVTHYNAANPENGQTANLVLAQVVSSFNAKLTNTPQIIGVSSSGVHTKNLNYIDFLLPGMVGISIMQLGIFSVAFAFVSFKTTGMLRRLQASPAHPGYFLTAQALTRLIIGVAQTALLVGIGVWFFSFHLAIGSWLPFIVLALMGSAVFMGIGFIIAGWARDEDQAQPVATLIQFPMMFLSGTFFPRDNFPHWLHIATNYLPLTYLADGLRQVANEHASLWAVRGDIWPLLVWGVLAYIAAVRVFKWE